MWNLVFPGQGSQHIGMGQFLHDNFAIAKFLFEEASEVLSINFQKLCFEGPEEELKKTANTQPALLLTSYATFRVLEEINGPMQISCLAGHSVGEYAACLAAGSFTFSEALKAVRYRGEVMQEAVPLGRGAMVAIMGATSEQVDQICQWVEDQSGHSPLEPANYNSPGQIVCSGSAEAIQWLQEHIKELKLDPAPQRLRLIPLKVSAPFHCSMMKPAQDKMEVFLKDVPFKEARWPIVQNFTAQPNQSADLMRKNLVEQISEPVRWIESLEVIQNQFKGPFLEVGSGKVLKGLIEKTLGKDAKVFNFNSMEDLEVWKNQ